MSYTLTYNLFNQFINMAYTLGMSIETHSIYQMIVAVGFFIMLRFIYKFVNKKFLSTFLDLIFPLVSLCVMQFISYYGTNFDYVNNFNFDGQQEVIYSTLVSYYTIIATIYIYNAYTAHNNTSSPNAHCETQSISDSNLLIVNDEILDLPGLKEIYSMSTTIHVTPYGKFIHMSPMCQHLEKSSTKSITLSKELFSSLDKKYLCKDCLIYDTALYKSDTGTKFHGSRNCQTIKNTNSSNMTKFNVNLEEKLLLSKIDAICDSCGMPHVV